MKCFNQAFVIELLRKKSIRMAIGFVKNVRKQTVSHVSILTFTYLLVLRSDTKVVATCFPGKCHKHNG